MADPTVSTRALETPEHDREIRIETICERVGWGILALILLAALLGFLGPGPFSWRDCTSADGSIRVQYNLIERYEAPAELRMVVKAADASNGDVRLAISRTLVDEITPSSVSPVPSSIETVGDRMVYTFAMRDLNEQQGRIVARYQNDTFGVLQYDIGLEGREPVSITQYVLP